MLNIYPTVALFSYIDLKTGKLKKQPFLIQTTIRGQTPQGIIFHNGIVLEKNGFLHLGDQKIKINSFVTVFYDGKGKVVKHIQRVDSSSLLFVVWMRSYNKVLIMDKDFFNSTFIQLFVFENYDKNLFEPVILNPWAKVYKVKK
jgi:dolichyl-diphosphooligosaccharide--protein glycosyltransferase/undecaprenyl-diphosphooligosaccharide--protein glycosyltransferase